MKITTKAIFSLGLISFLALGGIAQNAFAAEAKATHQSAPVTAPVKPTTSKKPAKKPAKKAGTTKPITKPSAAPSTKPK